MLPFEWFLKNIKLSNNLTQALEKDFASNGVHKGSDEVDNISKSVALFEKRLKNTFSQLERKVFDISILKELSDLCYVTFDPEELLYITLERGLKITHADIGSILILENHPERHFVIKASIGHEEDLNFGDTIDSTPVWPNTPSSTNHPLSWKILKKTPGWAGSTKTIRHQIVCMHAH